MMERLKESRWLYILVSVLIAVAFWLYIRNVQNTASDYTIYNVPVQITNSRVLNERGLTVASLSQDTVNVTVNAPWSVQRNLNRNNIVATVDVSTITEAGSYELACTPRLPTNVDTSSRILCYDIRDLGKQLQPVGMLVVLDSVFNRIIRNRKLGKNTWVYIDEIYLLFQHEYSANFLFTLWKRVRKYGACCTGLTQNVDDLLQSHTARTMLANSEFLVMLNQAATDRAELANLLNISDNQLSYITNVDSGRGLIKCGSAIVPFMNSFPKNRLYQLMTTRPSEMSAAA